MRTYRRHATVTGAIAAMALLLAACGGEEDQAAGGGDQQSPAPAEQTEMSPTEQTEGAPAGGQGDTTADDVFGPACDQVPTDPNDQGSVQGMIDDPVGTAASNNPLLTTLTEAATEAGLVDTLNDTNANYTVFAPADPAFDAVPQEDLQALMQDQEQLTSVLTYHVVPERMDAQGISESGTLTTVEGSQIEVAGTPEEPTVNGANVLCGNIPTANATVFVVDQVLMPSEQ